MTTMFSSVSNWLENVGMFEKSEEIKEEEKQSRQNDTADENTQKLEKEIKSDSPQDVTETNEDDDDLSVLAINTAKQWGSYLYDFGKMAGSTVAETANKIKHTVEEKTILGEFTREQHKFQNENRERTHGSEAAVPPWVGYQEEQAMKAQILELAKDKRNFLRNPPSGVQFQFDFHTMHPVATTMLEEDPNLKIMRFELVPKQITEESFWRNYFYRVSLIKQSAQLTTLAQHTGGSSGGSRRSSSDSNNSSSKDKKTGILKPRTSSDQASDEPELLPDSPHDPEFVSDAFDGHQLSDTDLRQGMQQLGVDAATAAANQNKPDHTTHEPDVPDWERELQQELQEYELVNEIGDDNDDDNDLENEILHEIEKEANSTQ